MLINKIRKCDEPNRGIEDALEELNLMNCLKRKPAFNVITINFSIVLSRNLYNYFLNLIH